MITKREVQLVMAQLIEQVGVLLKFTAELDKRVRALEPQPAPPEEPVEGK